MPTLDENKIEFSVLKIEKIERNTGIDDAERKRKYDQKLKQEALYKGITHD